MQGAYLNYGWDWNQWIILLRMEIIQQWLGSTPFDGILWWGSKSQSLDLGDFVTKQQMNLLNFQTIVFVRKFFWLDFCQRWDDEKRTKDCSVFTYNWSKILPPTTLSKGLSLQSVSCKKSVPPIRLEFHSAKHWN